MQKRPASVNIVSSWLIFSALLALVINVLHRNDPQVIEIMSRNPLPIPAQIAWIYTGILVSFVTGIAMMRGQNWARFLYIAWTAMTLLVSFLTSPVKIATIPGLFSFTIIAFFLFRRNVNEYFSS